MNPGKGKKEGQDDQGTLKQVEGSPLSLLPLPGPPGLPFASSLGSLELLKGSTCKEMRVQGLKTLPRPATNSNLAKTGLRNEAY